MGAPGRQVERAARRHREQPARRVEHVEEREEVVLVGAATVEQDEQALGVRGRRAPQEVQGVRGHVPQDVICGGSAP